MAHLPKKHFSLTCMQKVGAQNTKSRIEKAVGNWGCLCGMHKNIQAKNTNMKARLAIKLAKYRDVKLNQ